MKIICSFVFPQLSYYPVIVFRTRRPGYSFIFDQLQTSAIKVGLVILPRLHQYAGKVYRK